MNLSISSEQLAEYVARQIENTFPDGNIPRVPIKNYVLKALERVEFCFSHIKVKHYSSAGGANFNHLHSGQYTTFLYFLSNTIWKLSGDDGMATKIYYLNKSLHAVDVFYQVELPDIFFFEHPVGMVLGRAKYSNYFVAYQNCSVGGNLDLEYPIFDEGVALMAGATVIGNCHIKKNCWVSAGTLIMNTSSIEDQIVVGRHPNVAFKPAAHEVKEHFFEEL